MRRTPCNDGWKVRRKANRFLEMAGAVRVGAGHPPPRRDDRHRAVGHGHGANAYFPGGVWEYERTLEVPAEDEGTSIALAFEGVYRDVLVHVNREFAGHRPYGYSELVVPIDHLLRYGAENTLRVEARAFEDTRWYSGAGIHRNVWLLRAGRVHLAPDELVVRTPEVDDEVAIVTVGTVVRNQSTTRSEAVLRTELLDDRRPGRRRGGVAGDHVPGRRADDVPAARRRRAAALGRRPPDPLHVPGDAARR